MPKTALKSLGKTAVAARDPTDRHAKSQAMSMAWATLGMPFYLAVLLSLLSAPPTLAHNALWNTPSCAMMRTGSLRVSIVGTGNENAAALHRIGGTFAR